MPARRRARAERAERIEQLPEVAVHAEADVAGWWQQRHDQAVTDAQQRRAERDAAKQSAELAERARRQSQITFGAASSARVPKPPPKRGERPRRPPTKGPDRGPGFER